MEVKAKLGAHNYRMIIDEIVNGRLSKQQVKDIGLRMDPRVTGVYVANHLDLDLADVMRAMMDKWWEVKLFKEKINGRTELYGILSDDDLGLHHLAARIN